MFHKEARKRRPWSSEASFFHNEARKLRQWSTEASFFHKEARKLTQWSNEARKQNLVQLLETVDYQGPGEKLNGPSDAHS